MHSQIMQTHRSVQTCKYTCIILNIYQTYTDVCIRKSCKLTDLRKPANTHCHIYYLYMCVHNDTDAYTHACTQARMHARTHTHTHMYQHRENTHTNTYQHRENTHTHTHAHTQMYQHRENTHTNTYQHREQSPQ